MLESARGDYSYWPIMVVLVQSCCVCSYLNNGGSAQQSGKGNSLFSIFPPDPLNPFWSLIKVL
jgi:hypothetical protein